MGGKWVVSGNEGITEKRVLMVVCLSSSFGE